MAIERLAQLRKKLSEEPHSPVVTLQLSQNFVDLGYPDLAAGYAYKALLLIDEIFEDSGEYHDQALEAARVSITSSDDNRTDDGVDYQFQDEGLEPEKSSDDRIISLAGHQWREIA